MLRKIFKTGNSTVISLPKEYLEFLGIEIGAEVNVELDRETRQVRLTPVPEALEVAGVDETFAQQVSEFIEEYRPALEILAKS